MLPSTELLITLAGLAFAFFLILLWRCNVFCHTSPFGVLYDPIKESCSENDQEKSDKSKQNNMEQQQTKPNLSLLPQNKTLPRKKGKKEKDSLAGKRKELVENEVQQEERKKHDMKTFMCEDEKTGWNAGFSFHYTEA